MYYAVFILLYRLSFYGQLLEQMLPHFPAPVQSFCSVTHCTVILLANKRRRRWRRRWWW